MTRTIARNWLAVVVVSFVGLVIATDYAARGQERPPPQVATDWRQLTGTPQSVDLASIAPLELPHYSWPIRSQDVLPTPAWWLDDFVRITRGATIHADGATTEAHVRALSKVAAQYRAGVAIVHTPYHHASWSDGDPRKTDATYWPYWTARLTLLKSWVEAEGGFVKCIIFDCERFRLRDATAKDAAEWNAAMRARYDEAYDQAKAVFGVDCLIEWYSRGWMRPIGVDRWQRNIGYYHFDGTEKGDAVSAVVTRPDWTEPSLGAVLETLNRAKPTDKLVTWIWLGSAYRYEAGVLSADYDHDIGADACRGLTRLRTLSSRQSCNIFYPAPGSNVHWLRNFAEYAR